jgi:hypothetical protein
MFISHEEKTQLKTDIRDLQGLVDKLSTEVLFLIAKVKAITPVAEKVIKIEDRIAKKKEYSRRYYAKKKLANQNVTSISAKSGIA